MAAPERTVVTGRLVLDGEVATGWIEVTGDRISALGPGAPPDLVASSDPIAGSNPESKYPSPARIEAGDGWILPGLVDIHAHGGGGWSLEDGVDAARQAAAFHGSRGTTSLVASLVSGPRSHLLTTVSELAPLVHDGTLAGLHLEGPYLAVSRRGAHDETVLRPPDLSEVAELLAAGAGTIRMMTLAPELPGALDLVELLVKHGVVAAIGHTDATAEQCLAAVDRGARVATHLFNGMPPLHHRAGGPIAALAADPRVRCEVLHDGHHVEDSVLRLAHHLLAPDRLLLVSDAASATGCADGPHLLGELPVTLSGGAVRTADGRSLAGSAQPLGEQLARAVRVGLDPARAVAAATEIPARTLGLTGVGRLAVGARADLLVLDSEWQPVEVISAGRRL